MNNNQEINNNSGIYRIKNLQNGKIYIGKSKNIKRRWIAHKSALKCGNHFNSHLQSAWDKYGNPNFIFEVIETCDIELLGIKETYYINFYNTITLGYNQLTPNNNGGFTHSEESKLKMSKALKGIIFSEEHKRKISESNKGKINSKEHIRKMAESKRGKLRSEESKLKMSNARKGKPRIFSEEHKLNISKSHKGLHSKSYKFISPNNEIFEGVNIKKFAKENNLDGSALAKVMKGLKKHHKGWCKGKLYGTV